MAPHPDPTGVPDRRRLDSWKEIAAHLGRTVRTVQRWERDEGLPVHRHLHNKLGSVYAYTDEIDRWWAEERPSAPGDGATTAPEAAEAFVPAASVEPRLEAPGDAAAGRRTRSPWLAGLAAGLLAGGLSFAVRTDAPIPDAGTLATRAARQSDELYRQGRGFWQLRTPRGFDQARHAFEDALAANPNNAQARAGLADTYSLLEAFGLMPADEALPKARAEAERAVDLDPNLGEAHASLAFVRWELHDPAGAMAAMERALELDPDYATAHHWHGLFLQQFLRRDEAIAEARRAVALDPAQPVFWTDLASMLKHARRLDEAEAVLEEARQKHPAFPDVYIQLSDLALEREDAAQAVGLLRRAVSLGDNRPRIVSKLGCLEATTGNPTGAADALHVLRDLEASGQHVPDDALAGLLAWTGDLEGAFRHIRRGIDQRQEWVGGLFEAAACFEPVRRDPRWPAVVAELERASWLPLGSRTGSAAVEGALRRGAPGSGS
jgi:tetratricopeptide (TPR) repeat protein